MDVPLKSPSTIWKSSAAVETRVRERVAKLEKLFPGWWRAGSWSKRRTGSTRRATFSASELRCRYWR